MISHGSLASVVSFSLFFLLAVRFLEAKAGATVLLSESRDLVQFVDMNMHAFRYVANPFLFFFFSWYVSKVKRGGQWTVVVHEWTLPSVSA